MLKKLIILAGLLLTSVTAHATVISHFGYERDSASNIVTGGGLEWLKWDVTKGMSINSALSTHAAQGWRLASNIEMASLFNTFQFGSYVFTSAEKYDQTTSASWSPSEDTNYNKFLEIFGATFTDAPTCLVGQVSRCYPAGDVFRIAQAMFGNDFNNNGYHNVATVRDDSIYLTGDGNAATGGYIAILHGDEIPSNHENAWLGVALVRAVDTSAVDVPTPGPIGLLALGLVALGYRRRPVLAR